jgi:hypothetical protein
MTGIIMYKNSLILQGGNKFTSQDIRKQVNLSITNGKEKLTSVPYCQFHFLSTNSEKLDFKIHPWQKIGRKVNFGVTGNMNNYVQ